MPLTPNRQPETPVTAENSRPTAGNEMPEAPNGYRDGTSGESTGDASREYRGIGGAIAAGIELGKQGTADGYSLSPGTLLKNTARTASDAILLALLSKEKWNQLIKAGELRAQQQKAKNAAEKGMMPNMNAKQKIIMQLSRDATLFMRTVKPTVKNTVADTARETATVSGKLLQEFGNFIRPSAQSTHGAKFWSDYYERKKEEEREEAGRRAAENLTNETLASEYEERG